MRITLAVAVVVAGLLATAAPFFAHHAFAAEFDNNKPVLLKGKFTKMDFINPHSWVYFDVTYPDGKVVNWGAETPPPNRLYRDGWRKDTLKVGDAISVQGFASKAGAPRMWASRVTWVNASGQEVVAFNGPAPE